MCFSYINNATVCAHYLPIILEGSVTITAAQECGSELCVAPPPVCYCWGVNVTNKSGDVITYINCDGIPITVNAFLDDFFHICSENAPISINGSIIVNNGFCTTDCDLINCVCYEIIVTSTTFEAATINIETRDCNPLAIPQIITTTITSGSPNLMCSSQFPIVTSASSNAVITIVVSSNIDCVDCNLPIPCINCYEIVTTESPSTISWTDCDGNPTSFTGDAGVYKKCSLTYPTTTPLGASITLAPFNCDSGLCVDPCYFGTPPSCYTVTITGTSPAWFYIKSCANTFFETNVYYYNLLPGTIINTCSTDVPIMILGTSIITNNGPCTLECVNPSPVCICYRIGIYMGSIPTPSGTMTFSYIDCNDDYQIVTIATGDPLLPICSKSSFTIISFTGTARILNVTASTDNCALGQCI